MSSIAFYTVAVGIDETELILKNLALAKRFGLTVYTDRELDLPVCFEQRIVTPRHTNRRISSRYWKLFSFTEFETSYSVYFDANIHIDPDRISPIETRAAHGVDIGVFQHNRKRCIRDEILYCYAVGKLSLGQTLTLLRFVKYWGMPVFQGGLILRPTKNNRVQLAMERWWSLIVDESERDQITGPIALHREAIDWYETKFDGYIHRSEFSTVTPHRLGNFTIAGTVRRGDLLQRLFKRIKSL